MFSNFLQLLPQRSKPQLRSTTDPVDPKASHLRSITDPADLEPSQTSMPVGYQKEAFSPDQNNQKKIKNLKINPHPKQKNKNQSTK